MVLRKPLSVIAIFVAAGLLIGVLATSAQWTGPTDPPPNGNPTLVNGSGAAGRVAIWQDIDTLMGDSGLTFNGASNALDVGGTIDAVGDICTDAGGGVCLAAVAGSAMTDFSIANSGGANQFSVSDGQNIRFAASGTGLGVSFNAASRMVTYSINTGSGGLQNRVTGTCGANETVWRVNENGSVDCRSVTASSDITTITAGPGIAVSGSGNSRTVGLNGGSCSAGEVWTWTGAAWSCDPIAAGGPWTRTAPNTYLTNIGDRVGVGTATPASALELEGTMFFDCTACGDVAALNGAANWGDLSIQGRVLSANNNIHLSPPSGFNVIINDTYRAAGGPGGGAPGLTVEGSVTADGGVVVDGNVVIDDGAAWHRTYGNSGWYNGTFGGGWHMAGVRQRYV